MKTPAAPSFGATAAAASAAPAPPAACDPAPAPAPVRDRSLYVVSTVIVLCLVTLALGLYFTTTDRVGPTSTAVTTAVSPAQLETTTSPTTRAPDIPEVPLLQPLAKHLGKKFLTGMSMPKNDDRRFFEAVKRGVWNLSVSHGLTEVILTNQTSQDLKDCLYIQPGEECKDESSVFAGNRTITAMVKYAKPKGINVFAIRSAQHLVTKLELHRPFHLLKFTLASRQGMPAKETLQRSNQLRHPNADDSPSSESGRKTGTATLSAVSDTKQVEAEVPVVPAEDQAKSGVVEKTSSKPADSVTNIPESAWRRGSTSSPTSGTKGSRELLRQETKKPIKEASTPSSDMASSTPSVNDKGAVLTA